MKSLIAAGLAALALAATSVASADPIHPADDNHPVHEAVLTRSPIVHQAGFDRPGFYRTAYTRGHRGASHRGFRHHRMRIGGRRHHHIAWRGAYAGEHHPV